MARESTKIFLNTWGAYNEGCIGYGWMLPDEARDFIENDPERDGGEWFIADIDNYLGVEFGSLDYADVYEIIETIEALEELNDYELNDIVALMEYLNTNNALDAINNEGSYIFFADIEQYHECCDESLDFNGNEMLERYFDFDAYHRDCDFDIYEAKNGVCILG
jgi:hypothetical protein